jgi:hypothetical protein
LEVGGMFQRIVADTGTDVFMIGDKLQSIWGSKNVFVSMQTDPNAI